MGVCQRVELSVLAAHGHQGEEGNAAALEDGHHVDAVAHARALHQQHRALTAQPGTRGQGHALFFRGEHHGAHVRVGMHATNHMRMARVGHIAHLLDLASLEDLVNGILPGGGG